jgi:hypothetical protein
MELRGAEAPLFHVTAGVGDESGNKKRDPEGPRLFFYYNFIISYGNG